MQHQRHQLSGKAFLLGMNPVIRFMTMSDVVLLGAGQLLAPVFAVFVASEISGGNVSVVGLATALFFIAKSLSQIPAATMMDRVKGERDDFRWMFLGTLAIPLAQLLFLVISSPIELYLVQILLGVMTGITYPSYMSIFGRHLDRNHENMEWGVRFTLTDISAALGATIGGFLAYNYGFSSLIIVTCVVGIIGALLLLPIRRSLKVDRK